MEEWFAVEIKLYTITLRNDSAAVKQNLWPRRGRRAVKNRSHFTDASIALPMNCKSKRFLRATPHENYLVIRVLARSTRQIVYEGPFPVIAKIRSN